MASAGTSSTGLDDPCWFAQERCLKSSKHIMTCSECKKSCFLCTECRQSISRCPLCKADVDDCNFKQDSDALSTLHTISEAGVSSVRFADGVQMAGQFRGDSRENMIMEWKGSPTPRPYQREAFTRAVRENHIINLPTGTGKTLVAVMLIDYYLKLKPTNRVLFLVNQVALVRQQARVIRQQSTVQSLSVAELSGNDIEWTESAWRYLDQHQVLVGTAEIVRKALVDHGFLRCSEFSLVIFDEAHHAVRNHPFVEIVRRGFDSVPYVRIVGLTASYLHGRMRNPEGKRAKLEANLRGKIWAPPEDELRSFVSDQHFERVTYQLTTLSELWGLERTNSLLKPVLDDGDLPSECKSLLEGCGKKAGYVFALLGREGWVFFVKEGICPTIRAKLETKETNIDSKRIKQKIQAALRHLDQLQVTLGRGLEAMDKPSEAEAPQFSGKVTALLSLLEDLREDFAGQTTSFRCMLFCEQVSVTYPLAHLINWHFAKMISLPVSGVNSMPEHVRKKNVEAFGKGDVEMIVATNSMEEGIDIPSCNVVIRFDGFHNVKSHVQGAGRARHKDARIYYFENDPEAAQQDAQRMQNVARSEHASSSSSALVEIPAYGDARSSGSATVIIHPNTMAKLTPFNCLGILYEYAARVLQKSLRPDQLFQAIPKKEVASHIVSCLVPTPDGSFEVTAAVVSEYWSIRDFREQVTATDPEIQWSNISWARRRFAFVAVWLLIQKGYIGERNMPTERALSDISEHCESFLDMPLEASRQSFVRFHPNSLTPPQKDASSAVSGLSPLKLDARQDAHAGLSRTVESDFTHKEVLPTALIATSTSQEASSSNAPFDASPVLAAADIADGTAAVGSTCAYAEATREENYKCLLNTLMQKRLGRPLQKGDVLYELKQSSPFVATVRLAGLADAAFPTYQSAATINFTKKVEAEQSAAQRAVDALQAETRASAIQESCSSVAATTTGENFATSQVCVESAQTVDGTAGASVNLATVPAIRSWCSLNALPDSFAGKLEDEDVEDPSHLAELSDVDLDFLCEGLKLGVKAKFKKLVRELRN